MGIDTNKFRPGLKVDAFAWRRKLTIPETAIVVLSPRAFRQNYGHDVIVKAFARAVSNNDINAYLVLKAYDCWDRSYIDRISAIASECGIADRIRIIDEVAYDQLPTYYAMGDFAVNFPLADAFPVTFLECLACELPVLTRYLPAYNSLGLSSYLRFTDAPTEESLEYGISSMFFRAQSLRQEMSRARAYVSKNFDEAVVAKSLAHAYHRVLEARADPSAPRAQTA
jgi:glycosyltransferase involved in cell wall biosynthesis